MTRMISAVLIALSATQLVSAAPGDVSLTKPTVACPQTQLGDAALQPQYEELWRAYGEKVAEATKAVEDELTRLYEAAKADGNLDLALFWNGLKKTLAETGQLRWEPMSQKKDWKRFGEAEFPNGLASILSRSGDSYDKARDELGRGYKALEVALTKADKLEQALAMRKEFDGLWGAVSLRPVEPVAQPKQEIIDLLKQIELEKVQGWKRAGGTLVSGVLGKEKVSRLSVAVDIKGDYDIVAEVNLRNMLENSSGTLGMNMQLPCVEGSPRIAALTGKSGVCFYVASAAVGEKPPAITAPFTPGFKPNAWQEVLVRVRKREGEVQIVINGKEVMKSATFAGFPESEMATLGIDTGFNSMMVRRWEVRRVP